MLVKRQGLDLAGKIGNRRLKGMGLKEFPPQD